MPHLTYKVAIAMASAHLSLLHITYVDRLDDILKDDSIEVLKIIGFSMDGPKVLGPAGMEVEELDDLVVTSSALNNIEINHRLAQKGLRLRASLKNGIPAEQVMTIGDNLNDVSMIQWAGVSFAMGNAELELKEYAKYETATNLEMVLAKPSCVQ